MTDTTTEVTLTAHDIRALKHADTVCFDHHKDGTGAIRAILRAENSPTGFEQTHTIRVELSTVTDYSRDYSRDTEGYTGYAYFGSAKYTEVLRTFLSRLNTGTRVHLRWFTNNSSPVTKRLGVVRDELQVAIQRKGARSAEHYLLQTFVGEDNSARMVKGA